MIGHTTATDHADLLNKLDKFLTGTGSAFDVAYSGTGDGLLTGHKGGSASVAETFTLEATGATTFNVTGSVSGALADATVGTPYNTTKIAFTIAAGSSAFVAGDTFTINTAPAWTSIRRVTGSEMIWKAPGNDGAAEIYVGALAFSNVTGDYANWRLGGFTGYQSGASFTAQPGACTGPILPLWASAIEYWFIANGRRVVVIAKVGSSYESAYLGAIRTYGTPGQYPYPVLVGGSMAWASEPAATSANWRFSYSGDEHRAFFCPQSGATGTSERFSSARMRLPSGVWAAVAKTVPAAPGQWTLFSWPPVAAPSDLRPCLDGSYPLYPVIIAGLGADGSTNCYGFLDGVEWVTGHANSAENTVDIGRASWLVVPNATRSGKADFAAVRLD